MKKLSLSIAVFLSTFFSPHLFSTNLQDEQKEGSYFTQPNNQVEQPKQVCDYTILNNKNINHTLEDIEDVEEDLESDIFTVNAKLITTNNQSTPLLLGAVLQHKQTNKYHQYLIADTGLLSNSTQPKAVKRAHKTRFHLIKATRGHVSLQLLEWLQISKHYSVIALHTNRPVCRNCYLIAHNLWEKELPTNEKGCIGVIFPLLDKMPTLAQKYINTHLNLSLVQNLVVPMMGYVSKEEMNKSTQKNKEMASFVASMQEMNNTQIAILNKQVKTKSKQIQERTNEINNKIQLIETLRNQINTKSQELKEKDEQIITLQAKKKQIINEFNDQLEEKDEKINMLNKEINKKDNQIKEKDQKIEELQNILQCRGKEPLDDDTKKGLFEEIKINNVDAVKNLLDTYKNVVNVREKEINYTDAIMNFKTYTYKKTPFICAARYGRLEIAKLFKERGAYVYAKTSNGSNALHWACASSGSVEMITWLLDECKVDIESKGYGQITPFLCAAENGHLAIAKLLKERGANIYAKIENGSNALHLACQSSGNVEMVNWMLDICKLEKEAKGWNQRTPFLWAAQGGKLNIAKLLKDRGANVHAKDEDGKNALQLTSNKEMISYLKSLGLEDD